MPKQKLLFKLTTADKAGLVSECDIIALNWTSANSKAEKVAKKAKSTIQSLRQEGLAPENPPAE